MFLLHKAVSSIITNVAQNEYAKILQKRVAETKQERTEAKKRRASSMRK
jgi:hypothetical protein